MTPRMGCQQVWSAGPGALPGVAATLTLQGKGFLPLAGLVLLVAQCGPEGPE